MSLLNKHRYSNVLATQAEQISQQVMDLIIIIEEATDLTKEAAASDSKLMKLYEIVGIVSSAESLAEDLRQNLLHWALNRQQI